MVKTKIPELIVTMEKHHILIYTTQLSTSNQSKPPKQLTGNFLCQAEIDEPLQCQLKSTMKPIGIGYTALTEDVVQLNRFRHMPMYLT